MILLKLTAFSFLATFLAEGEIVDSSKYDCSLLPPTINVDHEVPIKTVPANSVDEAWERMKITMLPDSHYMWVYVEANAMENTTAKKVGDLKIRLERPSEDPIFIKDFTIDDNDRCYTFTMNYTNGQKMILIKVEETADKQLLSNYVTYDCSTNGNSGSCPSGKGSQKVGRLSGMYFQCLTKTQNIDACVRFINDPSFRQSNKVNPTCSFLPKFYQKYSAFTKEISKSIAIETAWKRLKEVLDPKSPTHWMHTYESIVAPGPGINYLTGGQTEYTIGLKNPDGYEDEYLSVTTMENDNDNHCHKLVVLGHVPAFQLNNKFNIVVDLTANENGNVQLQVITHECLTSNRDHKIDMCYGVLARHIRLVITYMKCKVEGKMTQLCLKKARKTWKPFNPA